jgi:hypothetical protein
MSKKWLNESSETLQVYKADKADNVLYDRFIDLGLPVLRKYKSGFLAEMGDIQVCLLIHVLDNADVRVEVCNIDDQGELKSRLDVSGQSAINMIKSFVCDFPSSVLTTSERKPLCLFSQKNTPEEKSIVEKDLKTIGFYQGFMSFLTLKHIVSNKDNKITVAVP